MTIDQINARIRKLSRINLKILEYLRECDLTHRSETGGPCQDPKCKAIARKYEQNEDEILKLIDRKYELSDGCYNVIGSLLSDER